jgi:hypothetical protein
MVKSGSKIFTTHLPSERSVYHRSPWFWPFDFWLGQLKTTYPGFTPKLAIVQVGENQDSSYHIEYKMRRDKKDWNRSYSCEIAIVYSASRSIYK